jgi:hypothetical protein
MLDGALTVCQSASRKGGGIKSGKSRDTACTYIYKIASLLLPVSTFRPPPPENFVCSCISYACTYTPSTGSSGNAVCVSSAAFELITRLNANSR